MVDDELYVRDETAAVAEALAHLLDVLAGRLPELAGPLQSARVLFDTSEAMVLVCRVAADGTGVPVLALRCDPHDAATFGRIAVPLFVPGGFGPSAQLH